MIPSHDPLGNEIIISPAEINILKAAGTFYEYIASNIDLDKNGIPDVLSQTEIRVASDYIIGNCGYFSKGAKQPVVNDKSKYVIYSGITLRCGMNIAFTNVGFSGPLSAPYSNIKAGYDISEGEHRYIIGVTREATNTFLGQPFVKGTYTLKLDNKEYQIEYANNDPYASLVVVIPTVHYDSNGIFTHISLEYRSLDGSVITNPANLILNMNGNIGNTLEQGTKLYNNFKQDGINHYDMIGPPSSVKLDISAGVKYVEINYQDLFGNGYILAYMYEGT